MDGIRRIVEIEEARIIEVAGFPEEVVEVERGVAFFDGREVDRCA